MIQLHTNRLLVKIYNTLKYWGIVGPSGIVTKKYRETLEYKIVHKQAIISLQGMVEEGL